MSVDGAKLLFEGFLQKRKDTLKIRWATYWFRLQNSTLFFYTQKNGSASHLRGYYYIYSVQSVREIQKANSNRYMFEMIMKNGKQKLLAAETAALRKEWVAHLWQAMRLSTSVVSQATSTHLEGCDQRDRNSSVPICSDDDSMMEMLPVRPLSAPAPLDHIYEESCSLVELNTKEEPMYQNAAAPSVYQQTSHYDNRLQWSGELSSTECSQEGDYDVLPSRHKMCEADASAEADEGVYDYPLSYRMSNEHHEETIYDVPSSVLRLEGPAGSPTAEEQSQEEIYWRI